MREVLADLAAKKRAERHAQLEQKQALRKAQEPKRKGGSLCEYCQNRVTNIITYLLNNSDMGTIGPETET
jgi:hypothetical protein